MQTRTHVTITLALLLCPACAPEDDLEFRTTYVTSASDGPVWNTNEIEDVRFSEVRDPSDNPDADVVLDSVTLAGGVEATNLKVEGGDASVVDDKGNVYVGDDLLGSDWNLGNWRVLPTTSMRLTERTVLHGTPRYTFMHQVGDAWEYNCPVVYDDKDSVATPGYARLLSGFTLDENTGDITSLTGNTYLACNTGATGKAADWGYYDVAVAQKNWGILETAIRVVRADYCYNGGAHTLAGASVWLEDIWGLQTLATEESDRDIEAVWGPNGLICHGPHTRLGWEMPVCGKIEVPLCAPGVPLSAYPGAWFMTYLN